MREEFINNTGSVITFTDIRCGNKMMKKLLAMIFVGVLALSLTACGNTTTTEPEETPSSAIAEETVEENIKQYDDTFTGLAEYIIENGEASLLDDQSCYEISFVLEDYDLLGEVKILAITNGNAAECETICLRGATTERNFMTLTVNADGTFDFTSDWVGEELTYIYTYDISISANEYTNETKLDGFRYNAETNELIDTNSGRNWTDVSRILDRVAISLAPANLSLSSLGFTSYEPDMERAKKGPYDVIGNTSTGNSSTGNTSDNKGASGYDMPNEGESFSDYVERVDPDLYDSITDRYNTLTGN